MPWSTPIEEINDQLRAEYRAKFTWEDAAQLLAEQTPLTLPEARWVNELEPTGLHPYDIVDQLILIFRNDWTTQGKIRAIKKLIDMRGGEKK